ncbi:hypothetical protein [Urbifossiella limnaea]|uniref:Esterase-like activity of phytase family protein n=1 Tax=Urbifossiella limnaea TaxID=2528023 RepID=A0A517XZU5_9BACT|nr:hypothetical protein [Urbifossiella limnaea]QDU23037.1 hypothetical protein ETAA1_50270 [Urbifossiella limnaea]
MRTAAGLLAIAFAGTLAAQPGGGDREPAAKLLYGHDLSVRPGGNPDWPKAAKIGVEVFQDDGLKALVAISDAGHLAVAPSGPVGADKKSRWQTGLDLKVRKAGEPEFTQKTKAFGVEVYRDLGTNRLLYAAEGGWLALAPAPGNLTADKSPKWHHALDLKVRALDQDTFENAKKIGLEVYRDENTGGLLYVTDVGAVAATPAGPGSADVAKAKGWVPSHGLFLRVRKSDEPDFTEKTRKLPVEVLVDETTGNLLYVSETGSIAAAPPAGKAETRGVTWRAAMNLKARKAGETDFAKAAKYGVEVFQDNRTGNLVFVSETGSIAVLPAAK